MDRLDQLKQQFASLESLRSQNAKRFLAEMEFVEGLAELEGKQKAWVGMIDRAWTLVEKAASAGWHSRQGAGAAAVDQAVLQAEKVLAPIGKAAKGTCTGLVSGVEYWFRVHAVGAAGPGPWSDLAAKRAT